VQPDHGSLWSYHPGDVAVDYMALDGYNYTGNLAPRQVFAASYDELAALDPDDPIMIAETGSIEYSGKANWITDLYMNAIPNRMPRIDLVVWFHVNVAGIPPFRLDTSQAALDAYRAVADSPEWE
jgi:beta-mannanase